MPKDFDHQYLKCLFDDLNSSYKKQADTLSNINTSLKVVEVSIKNIERKNEEQDILLKDHSDRLRIIEKLHYQCNAPQEIKGIWQNVKRLNAYMDMTKKTNDIDTGMIDTAAEKRQHKIDLAIEQMVKKSDKDNNMMKSLLLKVIPWLLIGIIIGAGLFGAIGYKMLFGDNIIEKPLVIEPIKILEPGSNRRKDEQRFTD